MADQVPATTCFYCFILLMIFRLTPADAKIVSGIISTTPDDLWEFVDRFCFLSEYGRLDYQFFFPKEYDEGLYKDQTILLYYDDQWPKAYPRDRERREALTCAERESVMIRENFQMINLTERYRYSGCEVFTKDDKEWYNCTGGRSFTSVRERWWYIAVANCKSTKGLYLEYTLTMLNDDEDLFYKHYSADEFFVVHQTLAMLCIYFLLLVVSGYVAYSLHIRQLYHMTYKLYLTSLCLEMIALVSQTIYWFDYAHTGKPKISWKYCGMFFEFMGQAVFLILIILMGKGFTITRARISVRGTVKIIVLSLLYIIFTISVFAWHTQVSDPALALYLYDSAPGYVLLAIKVASWIWFLYAVFFTVKHFPGKSVFYIMFSILMTVWFWCSVAAALAALTVIPRWMREKIVTGLTLFIMFIGHLIFLILTWPTLAKKTFPYHIKTTQIGIMETTNRPLPYGVSEYEAPVSTTMFGGTYEPIGERQFVQMFTTDRSLQRNTQQAPQRK